jgi:iron(II)-dependent oxidoreductase
MSVAEAAPSKNLTYLRQLREESDRLFQILTPEAIFERPIAERHRVLFYVGHLDGFDAIQICRQALNLPSPDPELDDLFQAGIDPDSSHLPADTIADWPSLTQVRAYVARCRERVDQNVDRVPEDLLMMVIEHREMHLETLAYMFHNFPHAKKMAPAAYQAAPAERLTGPPNSWIEIPAGEAVLGMPRGHALGWDNEFPEFRSRVPAFRIQKLPVTNGDYLEFVRQGAATPNFWLNRNGELFYRGMFSEFPLPLDWPVYVTQREAEAYTKWLGKALATEEQFDRAAYGSLQGEQRNYPWGQAASSFDRGNFAFKRWDPESVLATPSGDSALGVSQLVGNGWEWTGSRFAPFPGFESHPSYPGYSANFFDNEHVVLKGGSPRTASGLLRRSFRNWFRRDYQYMYAKFRCVDN